MLQQVSDPLAAVRAIEPRPGRLPLNRLHNLTTPKLRAASSWSPSSLWRSRSLSRSRHPISRPESWPGPRCHRQHCRQWTQSHLLAPLAFVVGVDVIRPTTVTFGIVTTAPLLCFAHKITHPRARKESGLAFRGFSCACNRDTTARPAGHRAARARGTAPLAGGPT